MNVLIINPPIRVNDKPRHIPHGLAIIANALREKLDIEPKFLDINAHRFDKEGIRQQLRESECDIVLIGGLAPVYRSLIELTAMIKEENSDAVIVAGGSAAMSVPDVLLDNSDVDIICTGEGEETAVELVDLLRKDLNADLSNVAGICFKSGGSVTYNPARPQVKCLDTESYLPAYDLLPMDVYLSNPIVGMGRDIDFISSRGCPYQCSFCYQPWGRRFRAHSVDFIIDGLMKLKNEYDIDFVSFQDDEFMAKTERVVEFCDKKEKYLPDLLWSCTGRTNIVTKNEWIVDRMRRAGCVLISFGFESGSQRMLHSMRKAQTIEQMEKTVEICRNNEMPVPCSFIIGMPGEDAESCDETLQFALRNNLPLDSMMFATPYPGTRLFDFALETGRIDRGKLHEFMLSLGDAREFLVNLTDTFTDDELKEKRDLMIKIARANYESFIAGDELLKKTKSLFGPLMEKYAMDESDIEHRAKHGGISIF